MIPVVQQPRVLVVDDEDTIRSVISEVLTEDGYEVTQAASGEEALKAFRQGGYPLVLTDIVMKRMTGLDLLKELKAIDPEVLVVIMTSHASVDSATSALRSGAYDYLTKPFEDLSAISSVVDRALDRRRVVEESKTQIDELRKNAEALEDLNRNLRDMAMRDGLTGLYNHRFFREALDRELARSARHSRRFSLIFADVDHFKKYNDTHGHLAGDDLLRTLAGILGDQKRGSTIVARYGGEEFVILLAETEKQGALALAERQRQRIEEYPFPGGESQPAGRVTLSLGVAGYPEDGDAATALIGAADRALYEAKHAGRNAVRG